MLLISLKSRDKKKIMFFNRIINKGYQAQNCQLCNIEFNMMKLERIHFCKRCKRYICSKCGKDKSKILEDGGKWSQLVHRICIVCKSDLDLINNTIEQYKMKWNDNSKFADKWLSMMSIDNADYQHFQKLFYKNQHNYESDAQIIEKDVILGRTDYSVFNYSMRQFLFIVQKQNDKSVTRADIANVLYALAAKHDKIGYCQGMSAVAAFLLCFCSQQGCFQIYSYVLENIYPNNFFVKSNFGVSLIGLLAEVYFLQQYFLFVLQNRKTQFINEKQEYNQRQIQRFRTIIELSATKCLLSLFVSNLSFSNVLFVWQQLQVKKSFQVIEKAFLALIYVKRKQVLQIKSFQTLQNHFETIDHYAFTEAYGEIQIEANLRKNILQKYYNELSNKWKNSSANNIRALAKATSFNEVEIKYLQSCFQVNQNGIAIKKNDFIRLLECYYRKYQEIDKLGCFVIGETFLSKIFDSYNQMNKQGLDFREFVCCFSICSKGKTKQKLNAILNTIEDKKAHVVTSQILSQLLQKLYSLASPDFQHEADLFMIRMKKVFKNQVKVTANQLYILLNDYYVSELTLSSEHKDKSILEEVISIYSKNQIK